MADRAQQIMRHWPGLMVAGLVAALTIGMLGVVALRAEHWGNLQPADWAAIRFTVIQATLSAAISVALAVPVARALAQRSFPGRSILVTLLGAPFILPVIVAILGLIAVFGRSGVISTVFSWFGWPPVQIYGLHGVVLAHVFFNLPLATRLILQGWLAIPAERFRLAASLGFEAREVARILERPMLRTVLPGATMVIFVICTTSFAVALALGGGPKATTIELAIYQAFRFEFDLGKAALLGIVQFTICAVAALVMFRVHVPEQTGGGFDRVVVRWDRGSALSRLGDVFWIMFATMFLLLPLLMVVLAGVPGLFDLPGGLAKAAARSLSVAVASAVMTIFVTLPMAVAIQKVSSKGLSRAVEGIGYFSIAASPLVVGTGLFICIFPFASPASLALPVTALVNVVMSLPFALRSLVPAVAEVEGRFGRLADSLDLVGWSRLRVLYLPRLRRPIGFSAGLAAALSMGDLGVIALFADPETATLPLYLYRLMAAYRMEQASGVALVLLALSLLVFWIFDRGGRTNAET